MTDDSGDKSKLEITGDAAPNVPTFACIVYVSKCAEGTRARVANLPDLNSVGASERDALSQIIPAFKKRVGELLTAGEEIPWIDPPSPMEQGEQKRFVPVHL